jgi:hypothetical protein
LLVADKIVVPKGIQGIVKILHHRCL